MEEKDEKKKKYTGGGEDMTTKEFWYVVWGAMKAGLLIAAIFGGLWILVAVLLVKVWS